MVRFRLSTLLATLTLATVVLGILASIRPKSSAMGISRVSEQVRFSELLDFGAFAEGGQYGHFDDYRGVATIDATGLITSEDAAATLRRIEEQLCARLSDCVRRGNGRVESCEFLTETDPGNLDARLYYSTSHGCGEILLGLRIENDTRIAYRASLNERAFGSAAATCIGSAKQ